MRRILLDTHVWLWLQSEPGRFSDGVLDQLRDRSNEVVLSAASSWEISIKYGLGELPLPDRPEKYVPDRMARSGVEGMAVNHAHTLRVAVLPGHHRDPFDRLLISQAQLEGLELTTVDSQLGLYVTVCRPDEES